MTTDIITGITDEDIVSLAPTGGTRMQADPDATDAPSDSTDAEDAPSGPDTDTVDSPSGDPDSTDSGDVDASDS